MSNNEIILTIIGMAVAVWLFFIHISDHRREVERLEAERDRYREWWREMGDRTRRAEAVVARCKNAIADSYELKDSDEPRPPDPDHSPR